MLGSSSQDPPPLGGTTVLPTTQQPFTLPHNATNIKKKRRPAGTPDPDAEVVLLSPRTLLESDRYVCEICNQGFQRDQNLQMHRRRHKVPWKLLKREASEVRKRVFVCPEPTCLHHNPCHALGDLVGIKKHFRRKHSSHRQWVCAKCSKSYAVQSDYKAHLKTCGTHGHSCDCGRVFSRVECFIEHQDTCTAGRARAKVQIRRSTECLSMTASSPGPSSDTNFSPTMWPSVRMPNPAAVFSGRRDQPPSSLPDQRHSTQNIELQLLPPSNNPHASFPSSVLSLPTDEAKVTKLQLSIGTASDRRPSEDPQRATTCLKDETCREQLKLAMAEKALAEEARQQARRQNELAKLEFENANRIRQQAQLELKRAHAIREHSVKQISSTLLQITCYACKKQFWVKRAMASEEKNSFAAKYLSSVVTEEEKTIKKRS